MIHLNAINIYSVPRHTMPMFLWVWWIRVNLLSSWLFRYVFFLELVFGFYFSCLQCFHELNYKYKYHLSHIQWAKLWWIVFFIHGSTRKTWWYNPRYIINDKIISHLSSKLFLIPFHNIKYILTIVQTNRSFSQSNEINSKTFIFCHNICEYIFFSSNCTV